MPDLSAPTQPTCLSLQEALPASDNQTEDMPLQQRRKHLRVKRLKAQSERECCSRRSVPMICAIVSAGTGRAGVWVAESACTGNAYSDGQSLDL